MSVKNADPYHSDHRPVVVVIETFKHGSGGGSNFKFEATWLQEEGCRKVIEDAWGLGGNGESCLRENLSEVAATLKEWSVNALGDLEKWLKLAKKELEKWRREPISDLSMGKEAVWSFKVDMLEEQIDLYWRQ